MNLFLLLASLAAALAVCSDAGSIRGRQLAVSADCPTISYKLNANQAVSGRGTGGAKLKYSDYGSEAAYLYACKLNCEQDDDCGGFVDDKSRPSKRSCKPKLAGSAGYNKKNKDFYSKMVEICDDDCSASAPYEPFQNQAVYGSSTNGPRLLYAEYDSESEYLAACTAACDSDDTCGGFVDDNLSPNRKCVPKTVGSSSYSKANKNLWVKICDETENYSSGDPSDNGDYSSEGA